MGCPVFFCGKTEAIVPQTGSKERCVFHRVPLECPLPDTEVCKSATAVASHLQVVVTHDKPSKAPRITFRYDIAYEKYTAYVAGKRAAVIQSLGNGQWYWYNLIAGTEHRNTSHRPSALDACKAEVRQFILDRLKALS